MDFFRALAIILVMVRHFLDRNEQYDPYIPTALRNIGLFGWSGVDLFFVISGFLIFSIIFREEDNNEFSWLRFYLKRALRIWPAYFASLFACWWLGIFPVSTSEYTWFILFLQNYVGPLSQLNGGVYWSIAVEEHFYLVAPALLIVSAVRKEWRGLIVLSLLLIPLIIRIITYVAFVRGQMNPFYTLIYFPTHTRFDSLAFGVGCAYIWSYKRNLIDNPTVRKWFPTVVCGTAAAAIYSTAPLSLYSQQPSFIAGTFGFTFTAAFWATALLAALLFRTFDRLGRRTMKIIAYLSFSLYLYHIIALRYAALIFTGPPNLVSALLHGGSYIVLAMVMAGLSYFLVERPFLLIKFRIAYFHRLGRAPAG